MVYVVMGVSGSGKTTVGKLLAEKLGLPFHDADDQHPKENVEKMKLGIPLTDEDREPWLQAVARAITEWNRGMGAVVACSALKDKYRRELADDGAEDVVFIHLHGSPELIRGRLQSRTNHYFPPSLLDSQLIDLETPGDAISVDVKAAPGDICHKIMRELAARGLLKKAPGDGRR